MLDWNPALYRRYEDERTRPARELLARVPLSNVGLAIDLGCGPGNSTELLAERFEGAEIVGVDNSEAMLASARERLPQCRFDFGDIASWVPSRPPDLIYANAALQWVPQHEELIPRLFASLAPGGVLAIQMPDNRGEPTHRLMREVAAEVPWADAIGNADALRTRLLSLAEYYDLLAPAAAKVDVWHTIYQHPMASAAAIVEWVRGTGLKPFVDRLSDDLAAGFLAEYESRVDKAYAKRIDGRRLLAFPRMFIVAQKT
ncbi:MAG: trans-aconitate 2-methyltransferase [Gammaproteobacteria bacterium]|nr:trans-aconitate 2-methyltransferase [Gammaproteobacteria bacterium]MBU1443757.1 trans-aconitate 2-methyltransferase [Gammaproteobacteria bacterium]MBU2287454.1 trans-aconitate 2-methyltransferase [Gammaproteobacteria bacterium]